MEARPSNGSKSVKPNCCRAIIFNDPTMS